MKNGTPKIQDMDVTTSKFQFKILGKTMYDICIGFPTFPVFHKTLPPDNWSMRMSTLQVGFVPMDLICCTVVFVQLVLTVSLIESVDLGRFVECLNYFLPKWTEYSFSPKILCGMLIIPLESNIWCFAVDFMVGFVPLFKCIYCFSLLHNLRDPFATFCFSIGSRGNKGTMPPPLLLLK